jgi:hypothetical protein
MRIELMLTDVLKQELDKLNRAEKLRVVQTLVEQLAQEEELFTSREYEIWSPYDAPGAAAVLMDMLEEDRRKNG